MNSKFLIIAIAGILLTGAGFVLAADKAITGYAWSENIGWIQFNPAFDGVSYDDSSGEFKGYAWSENIGWIQFNPSGPFPEAGYSVKVDLGTGKLTGWAKAIAGGSGGWDGWIKMYDTGADAAKINWGTGAFSGWAWGSDVIGWISLSGVKTTNAPAPTVTLSASPAAVDSNNASVLSWSSTDAVSCSASGDWSGVKAVSGSESTGNLISAKTYSLTCTGPGGNTSAIVTVNVNPESIPNFSLSNSGILHATIIAGADTDSNSVIIKVVGIENGFDSDVNLFIQPIPGDPGFVLNLADNTLTELEYDSGTAFSVRVPGLTPIGIYPIEIKGIGGSLTRSVTVQLSVENLDPRWIEI